MSNRKFLRRPQWYRMESFFDGEAEVVTEIGDAEVVLQGTTYETTFGCPKCGHKVELDRVKLREDGTADLSPQLGICLVPQRAISNSQGEALRRMLEANLRQPIVLLSDNIQMVRLKPIHTAEADRILAGGGDGEEGRLVSFPGANRQSEQAGGQDLRAADSDRSEADPGSVGADEIS